MGGRKREALLTPLSRGYPLHLDKKMKQRQRAEKEREKRQW
jgi:hypothetical protein